MLRTVQITSAELECSHDRLTDGPRKRGRDSVPNLVSDIDARSEEDKLVRKPLKPSRFPHGDVPVLGRMREAPACEAVALRGDRASRSIPRQAAVHAPVAGLFYRHTVTRKPKFLRDVGPAPPLGYERDPLSVQGRNISKFMVRDESSLVFVVEWTRQITYRITHRAPVTNAGRKRESDTTSSPLANRHQAPSALWNIKVGGVQYRSVKYIAELLDARNEARELSALLECWHVLHDEDLRCKLVNESQEVEDEGVSRIIAVTTTLHRESLAWWTPGKNDRLSATKASQATHRSRVEIAHIHLKDVSSEILGVRGYRPGIQLERPGDAHPCGHEAKGETAGSAEEIDNSGLRHVELGLERFFRPAMPLENELLVGEVTSARWSRGSTSVSSQVRPMWSSPST